MHLCPRGPRADIEAMASKGGSSVGKPVLIPLALLSAFLYFHAFALLPEAITPEVALWASAIGFALGAVMFGMAGAALWCGLCAAMAIVLNPVLPLPLGESMFAAEIVGGSIAGASVVRNW